jgi:hypothetical protein
MAEGCELDLSSLPHLSGMTSFEEKRKWKMKFKKAIYVRFQVLTAASMMFRVVFWDDHP